MNKIPLLLAVGLFSGAAAGCTGGVAKPIGLDVALRGVETDLKAASGVSLHDIVSGDGGQEEDFKRAISQAQCFYRRANPVVPVMTKEFTLTLHGTFATSGKFLVSGLPATGGIQISAAEALQQTLALPVTFASVSSLPDIWLQQKAGYVKDFPESERIEYLKEAFTERAIIRTKIKEMIGSYSEERCRHVPVSATTLSPTPQ